jgi:hypothetical protein
VGEKTDQLRQEIEAKRGDAAEKIGQIEDKVAETVGQVKEQVRETFDWRHQVEQKPLVALGVAFVGGMVLAGAVGGGDDNSRRAPEPKSNGADYNLRQYGQQGKTEGDESGGLIKTVRNAAKSSGLESTISGLAGAFMMTVADRVKDVADQAFPGMASRLDDASRRVKTYDKGADSGRSDAAPTFSGGPGNLPRESPSAASFSG